MKFNWRHIPLAVISVFALFPMFLLFMNAFKKKSEISKNPLGLPKHWSFDNFSKAWEQGNYDVAYLNTLIITCLTVLFVCIVCGLAAYGMTFLKTPGSGWFLGYLFVSMSMPLGFIPIFFMSIKLNLINTHMGVIIPSVGGAFAFNVFLLRAFMLGIPKDLLEAAKVDGSSTFKTFLAIILPLAKPAFIVVAIFTTLGSWNEIFLSNAILQADTMKTVSVAYLNFTSKYGTNWGLMAAGGVMTVIPMVVLFLTMTKKFVHGLQEGGVKF
ncbi:carbohydrate ABC transporter permease [Cohnella lupini]|uniref:Raffinose/stachyose/melibiose transport system permease protein n=1 Tax=Cohnella lupini TaxID=1294267 RepID=A0A3D9IQY5_9BACL|nr:carbohydrate ABC transporter permease [Cohnella lupini]RED64058.1 raffinose/stachyose/melibiose transport system permease protein [Cohnella lupini]